MDDKTPTEDTQAPPAAHRSSHRVAAIVLVVLGTLSAFLAVFAVWINRQVMNTDNWTDTSSQMLEDSAIRTSVSNYLVDQLYANVDVTGEIRSALPPRAQPLAPAAAGALRNAAENVTNELLQRPRVQGLWEDANRTAHQAFLKVVQGGGPAVSTEGGVVKLDLGAMLQQLQQRTGVGGRVAAKLPPGTAQVTILKSNQLSFAQDVANALRPLAIALVALALVLYGIAIALARDRRRETLRAVGYGFIVAGVLALLVRSFAGDAVVNSLAKTEAARPAVESVWRIGTSLLVQAATATIGYGVVIVLAAWLAGPTRAAVASRRGLAPFLQRPGYAWGGAAAIVLIVLAWSPTPATRNVVTALVLIAIFALGVEMLRRQAAREYPSAEMPEIGAALRRMTERVRRAPEHLRREPAAPAGAAPGANGAPSGEPKAAPDPVERLERLADLHDRGALTDEEFADGKQALLKAG